jgi:hypothetical protein
MLYQLRGVAMNVFRQLGGGETFLKSERKCFDRSVIRKERMIEKIASLGDRGSRSAKN